ncbi:MAG: hypothetical protein ACOYB2_19530 [Limnohabitans sp.]
MASGLFNIARGKMAYYCTLPAASDALVAVLFQQSGQVADSVMRDYTTLAAIKAANTEATFTNYVRKTAVNIHSPNESGIVPDYVNDSLAIDFDDIVWTAAGGATNNSIGRLVLTYVPNTTISYDSTAIPLVYYDFVTTTDGTTRSAQINSGGFWKSTSPA